MIWDALVWLAIAKIAVMLVEDASFAMRGKQSPRLQRRARQQAAAVKSGESGGAPAAAPAATGWGRVSAAAGGYLAGLIEDGGARARSSRRRRAARRRGRQAVDGVLVDVDDDRWYADCDVCGWSSRPYAIDANARLAGAKHARGHGEVNDDLTPAEPARPGRGWTPTVIRGGRATDTARPPRPAPDKTAARRADPDRDPDSTPAGSDVPVATVAWRCEQHGEGFATEAQARADADQHPCGLGERPDQRSSPSAREPKTAITARDTKEDATSDETDETDDVPAVAMTPSDRELLRAELYGKCGYRIPAAGDGFVAGFCDNPVSGQGTRCWQHESTNTNDEKTNNEKGTTVNLEATGPEEIRAAFAQAVETAGEQSEETVGMAGVLTEAADRYESLQMAASTVGHLRDAAEAYTAAAASLAGAMEELQAALADFNSKDGAVAEAADAAGNLANKEVLVG